MVDMVTSCAVCAWWLMMWGHWRGATMGRLKIASNSFDPAWFYLRVLMVVSKSFCARGLLKR
jgi:hypothetical protein